MFHPGSIAALAMSLCLSLLAASLHFRSSQKKKSFFFLGLFVVLPFAASAQGPQGLEALLAFSKTIIQELEDRQYDLLESPLNAEIEKGPVFGEAGAGSVVGMSDGRFPGPSLSRMANQRVFEKS